MEFPKERWILIILFHPSYWYNAHSNLTIFSMLSESAEYNASAENNKFNSVYLHLLHNSDGEE